MRQPANSFRATANILTLTLALTVTLFAQSERGATSKQPPPNRPRGALVIVGGGGTPDSVLKRAIELAGGADARVVVLPLASQRPETGPESVQMFRDAGAARVISLPFAPDDDVDDLAELKGATLIWFPGGDQNRLMAALREASIIDLIRDRYREGAVVGGTSAGAAVMSDRMLTGEADLKAVRRGGATLADGLGLWRGVIVDQHFLRRQRFNRLLTVVLENPALVGVGIDEQTAVIVQGEKCEVLGESGVTLIDAREAANTATRESAARDADRSTNETDKIPLSARGVRLDLIRAGETFVVARRAGAKREADQP